MRRSLCLLTLIVVASSYGDGQSSSIRSRRLASLYPSRNQPAASRLARGYASFPLMFEPNQGQVGDKQVKFVGHGAGYSMALAADRAVLTLGAQAGSRTASAQLWRALMHQG